MKKNLKVNTYEILDRAIENGINCGYRRAHKHTDSPTEDQLKEEIRKAVMLEACEVFKF